MNGNVENKGRNFINFIMTIFALLFNTKINFFVLFSGSPKELKNQAGVTRV